MGKRPGSWRGCARLGVGASGGLGLESEVTVALLIGDGGALLGGEVWVELWRTMAPRHHLHQAPGVCRPRRADPCAPQRQFRRQAGATVGRRRPSYSPSGFHSSSPSSGGHGGRFSCTGRRGRGSFTWPKSGNGDRLHILQVVAVHYPPSISLQFQFCVPIEQQKHIDWKLHPRVI